MSLKILNIFPTCSALIRITILTVTVTNAQERPQQCEHKPPPPLLLPHSAVMTFLDCQVIARSKVVKINGHVVKGFLFSS